MPWHLRVGLKSLPIHKESSQEGKWKQHRFNIWRQLEPTKTNCEPYSSRTTSNLNNADGLQIELVQISTELCTCLLRTQRTWRGDPAARIAQGNQPEALQQHWEPCTNLQSRGQQVFYLHKQYKQVWLCSKTTLLVFTKTGSVLDPTQEPVCQLNFRV